MLTNIYKIEDRKYLKKKLESIVHIPKPSFLFGKGSFRK